MPELPLDPWTDTEFRSQLDLDVLCRDFEKSRRLDPETTIETILKPIAEPFRRRLAEELVAIECELRRTEGESPSVADYAQRFPELSDVLPELVLVESIQPRTARDRRALDGTIRTLGEFQILREIGRGGMGVVYEATQLSLGRRVALKILNHAGQLRPESGDRFLRESKILAVLQHPHIVQAYSAGQQQDVLYLAMEFVNGRSLAQIFATARDSRQIAASSAAETKTTDELGRIAASISRQDADGFIRLAGIGAEIADALDYAHRHNILHRDVKPSNVLLDLEGRSYLTDFGLAKLVSDDDELTQTGDWLGTLRYSAPEVLNGQYDSRSDQYSWGLSLYELAILQTAYDKGSRAELVKQVVSTGSPLRQLGAKILPRAFQSILRRATEFDPNDRYASANDFAEDLRRYVNGQVPLAHRRFQSRRWRRGVAIAGGVLIALAGGLSLYTFLPSASPAGAKPVEVQLPGERSTHPKPEQSTAPATNQRVRPVATLLQRFKHGTSVPVRSVDLSHDGSQIATGSDDGAIRLWDVKSGTATRTIAEPGQSVRYLHFSPDDRLLVTALGENSKSTDLRIKVQDLQTRAYAEPAAHPGFSGFIPMELSNLRFFSIRNSLHISLLIIASGSDAIIWEIRTGGKMVTDLNVAPAKIRCLTHRMGGLSIPPAVILGDDTGLVHFRTHQHAQQSHTFNPEVGQLRNVAFSPYETVLACWGERGLALSHAPHRQQTLMTFAADDLSVQHVAMSADNKLAAVATERECRLVDLETLTWRGSGFKLDEPLSLLEWFEPSQTLILVSRSGRLRLVDAHSGMEIGMAVEHRHKPVEIRWCNDRSLLAITDETGTATVYQIALPPP